MIDKNLLESILKEALEHIYILLCGFFVLFLVVLGVVRFYRSMSNRIRQYQLEYLKYFEMLNEDMFNRLLKSKRKSTITNNRQSQFERNIANVIATRSETSRSVNKNTKESETITDESSSITILSLESSSLDDYKSILDGRQVKSRVMYDLESIVRESVIVSNKKKRINRGSTGKVKRCNNPKCKKNHARSSKHHNHHRKYTHRKSVIPNLVTKTDEFNDVVSLKALFEIKNAEQEDKKLEL
jgi:hypothetical protein